jgi:hypothetical protein
MAESSLSLGWTEFKQEVGRYLNWKTSGWSAAKETEIERIVNTGYRWVLYPPAYIKEAAGYNWSFLRPTTTLSITSGIADYTLPDAFGTMIGRFHYAADVHLASPVEVSIAEILDMRSHENESGDPQFFAIRYKSSDGSTGQRSEVLFYPKPDTNRTLSYSYEAYQSALSATIAYPLGGMHMSELYKAAMLAVAEFEKEDEYGIQHERFKAMLIDAILRDQKRGAKNWGHMGDPLDYEEETFRRGKLLYNGAYSLTYKGAYL